MISLGSHCSGSELFLFFPQSIYQLFFLPTSLPPSPEASTNRLPLSHRRVHAGPYGSLSDAQLEGESCEAHRAGVRGDAWTEMGLGNHWADGAGRLAEPGSARARSGRWWEEARGGQSLVRCEQAVSGGC